LYGKKTSTTTLRKHLCSETHIDKWIAECKRLGIQITAKEAVETIAAYQGVAPNHQASSRPQFTQERFIDAIAEFIIATDQV
jgi:hypothetical protein